MDTKQSLQACRALLTSAVANGDYASIQRQLRRAWSLEPSASLAAWTARGIAPVAGDYCTTSAKVAFLRSYTVEPVVQQFTSQALCERMHIEPWIGNFNTYSQEILDPGSELYRFEPHVVVLGILTRSIAPELWGESSSLSVDQRRAVVERVCGEFSNLFDHFRRNSSASMIVQTLELPPQTGAGIGDHNRIYGQIDSIEQVNRFLRESVSERPGLCLLNSEYVMRRLGADKWYDPTRWNSIRLPMTGNAVSVMATEWLKYVGALMLPPRKVAVIDLDETMWHGIVGEDGFDGIRMDESPVGWPHRLLQQALIDLYHRGILLAVCSKNNHLDAWNVIERHPDMLLRPKHFATTRINWTDKGTNLREIAQELNVGLDSLVFLDNSAQERELVRATVPQVHVLEVNDDAAQYTDAIRSVIGFERIWVTEDDQKRGQIYAQQRDRERLKADSQSLEGYLQSLGTVVTLEPLVPATIERVAQLTGKTNQFNLTTKRYSSAEIQLFADSGDSEIVAFSVQDRFGDNGIVGVAILNYREDNCIIDTLLLSCRVIGRGIETAMLSVIVDFARARGCRCLHGQYIATEKNSPCANYFQDHGFSNQGDGWFSDDLESRNVPLPAWIKMTSHTMTITTPH